MLRPYQQDLLIKTFNEYKDNKQSVCICIPTGGGKTTVASEIAIQHLQTTKRSSVVWLAPLRELIEQSKKYFPTNFSVVTVDETTESQETMFPRIHMSTVQSLSHAGRRFRPRASLLILDEAQFFWGTEEWSEVYKYYREQGTRILSLSATPYRVNGEPLNTLADSLLTGPSIKSLISDEYLTDCKVFSRSIEDIEISDPVECYKKYANKTKAALFCYSVDEAKEISEKFNQSGIRSGWCSSTDRASIVEHRNNNIDVLCNVYMLSVGYDDPSIETIIINRRIGNPSTYIQMCGRALRSFHNKKEAKIIDLYGVVHQFGFGLPTDDRIYSLDEKPVLVRDDELVVGKDFELIEL